MRHWFPAFFWVMAAISLVVSGYERLVQRDTLEATYWATKTILWAILAHIDESRRR